MSVVSEKNQLRERSQIFNFNSSEVEQCSESVSEEKHITESS